MNICTQEDDIVQCDEEFNGERMSKKQQKMYLPERLLLLADAISEVRYLLHPFFVNHFRSI